MATKRKTDAKPPEEPDKFPDTPTGWAKRWDVEFEAADRWLDKFPEQGKEAERAFGDKRAEGEEQETCLNFFWANTRTLQSMLYGKTPQADVTRKYGDSDDDEARVGGEALRRALNADIERKSDGYAPALHGVLTDFLLVGFGNARARYWAEFKDVEKPAKTYRGKVAAPAVQRREKVREDVCTDFYRWDHQRWSPCETFESCRWWAFMAPMTRQQLHERFDKALGADKVARIPMNARASSVSEEHADDEPWQRAEVWEIWDKEHEKVWWWVKGCRFVLDSQDDPYQLEGFWPFPAPLFSNLTTEKLVPTPDYKMARDLYKDINLIASRITSLERALRVAGVYDSTFTGMQRLMEDTCDNELVPVLGYGAIAEKGGLQGLISWLPIEQVVAALERLKEQLAEKQRLLYELTGWSDLMRGQQMDAQTTAAAARAMVRSSSVRVQRIQDEFARYASDLQRIRAELMLRFMETAEIARRSNMLRTPDRNFVLPSIERLRADFPGYRVEVKPENVSLSDFAAMKAERTEFVTAFASLLKEAAAAKQMMGPQILPAVAAVMKWQLSGFRGSSTIEGVFDKLVKAAEDEATKAAQAGPQPNPEAQKAQVELAKTQAKAQADMQREQVKTEGEAQRQNIKTMAEQQRQNAQLEANVRETELELGLRARAEEQRLQARGAAETERLRTRAKYQPAKPAER